MMALRELVLLTSTLIVDVSSEEEFRSAPLPGAVNIPLDQVPIRSYEIAQAEGMTVIVYSTDDGRSAQAVNYLQSTGMLNILDGGSRDTMLQLLNEAMPLLPDDSEG